MTKEEILKKAEYYARLNRSYSYVLQVFNYDQATIAPKGGAMEGNEAISFVANELFKISKTDEYKELVEEAYKHRDEFDEPHKRLFEIKHKELVESENIDPETNYKLQLVFSNGGTIWEEAKNKSDYSIFKDALKDVIEADKLLVELKPTKFANPYDSLLDSYEEGMNTEMLDNFFSKLKERIVPLLQKIKESKKKIRTDFLSRKVSKDIQQKISIELLKFNDFNLNSGVLSESEHPFTCFPSHNDVRVTTHYYEDMFASNIYSVIHEGGHAIFAQNEPDEFYEIGLSGEMSMAQHETISRFYENIIGRSKEYTDHVYDIITNIYPELLSDVSKQEFFEAVNVVEPSLIRTEADELTYSLHIMIRYELEKALMNNTLTVDNVKEEWNRLYKEYLGVDVTSDKEGILQDMHWSDGMLGYFPTYALGNAYGAQILNTMRKDLNFEETLKNGDLKTIKAWLKEHVFSCASLLKPKDWLIKITGEELNPDFFLDYLENKYSKLYDLK